MTAPLAPMEARCKHCHDTGSLSKNIAGDLDCTHCDAPANRIALGKHLHGTSDYQIKANIAWIGYLFAQRQAASVAQPALPKLPSTPEEVVAFIGDHFTSMDTTGPEEGRFILLTVHDMLSAFEDYEEFPIAQPIQATESVARFWNAVEAKNHQLQPAQQVEAVGKRITQAEIDYIGEQWDECMYDAPGMMIDIGQAIRAELAKLNVAPQLEAQQAGDVALKAARYDWLRTSSVGQWEHPIVVEQLRDKKFNRINYIGPLSGCALDDAIDAAMAKEKA